MEKGKVATATQTEEFEYLFSSHLNINRKPFDRWEFVNDDEKVNCYAGLPSYDILNTVFNHISPFVTYKSQNLSRFQEFTMTLMKLSLDAPHHVFISTVSRIFSVWMEALVVRLPPLIYWPEREDLW